MYKHILLPTDGSEQDNRAIANGVALAKMLGARVTGVHVIVETGVAAGIGKAARRDGEAENPARAYLAEVTRAAKAAEVPCACFSVTSASAADGIVKAAEERACDLIAMASHGHRGVVRLLLGSVTAQVLRDCKVPVLVYR